ncbi:unnamed protein product [Linum tenue]|jgi:hypothetical protein
MFLSL